MKYVLCYSLLKFTTRWLEFSIRSMTIIHAISLTYFIYYSFLFIYLIAYALSTNTIVANGHAIVWSKV